MPELVGDAGIISPCNDVDKLADALLTLLRDSALSRTLGERGQRRFRELYNWDSVWQTIARELHAVLS
jgi:glycosyltransferase involved in cell wall biosynthesis